MTNATRLTDTEQSVADYLAAQGVTFAAALVGETTRDAWKCDEWRIRLDRRVGPGAKPRSIETPFYTGIGHRKAACPMPADIKRLSPRIVARHDWEAQNVKPVAPCAASVVHSLMLDSHARGVTFASWCADCDYDTDSRKALATYEAGQKISDMMDAFFTREERDTLATMLEDY